MKDELLASIRKSWSFAPDDEAILAEAMEEHKFCKDEFLLQKGQICQSFFLVQRGAVYQYRMNNELEQEVTDLHTMGDWVVNSKSFTGQNPSESFIKVFEDCSVCELRIEVIHHLINRSNAFFQLGNLLQYADTRLEFLTQYKTPDERYGQLIEKRPELLKTFPLRMIASYLQLTPETLSRVRRRIVK